MPVAGGGELAHFVTVLETLVGVVGWFVGCAGSVGFCGGFAVWEFVPAEGKVALRGVWLVDEWTWWEWGHAWRLAVWSFGAGLYYSRKSKADKLGRRTR